MMSIALKTSLLAALALPGWGLEAVEIKGYGGNCTGTPESTYYKSLKCSTWMDWNEESGEGVVKSEQYVKKDGNVTINEYTGEGCTGNVTSQRDMQTGVCNWGSLYTVVNKNDLIEYGEAFYEDGSCTTSAGYSKMTVNTNDLFTKCHQASETTGAKYSCDSSGVVVVTMYKDVSCSSINQTSNMAECQAQGGGLTYTKSSAVCASILSAVAESRGTTSGSGGRSLGALLVAALAAIGSA